MMAQDRMSDHRKTLVFPVEILSREFDSKLLLALCARERGWKVMIGNMATINAAVPQLEPSVYFAKSARSSNSRLFALLHKLGHDVVVLDEEVLVRQTDDIYLMKHEKDALKHVDLLLTWGEDSRALWDKAGIAKGVPIRTSGNPRVDMLLPELRGYHQQAIDDIRQRFGAFVLFNSNFGTVNNRVTGAERFNLAKWVDEKETDVLAKEFLTHKRAIFEHFRYLIPAVAKAIAPTILVVRPHPAEDHGVWNEIAAAHDNIRVVFEGSVVPWITAAKVLIHNGCTSAVEAALAGTPVISYRPITSEKLDNALPNSAGVECFSEAEVIRNVQGVLAGKSQPLTVQQLSMLHHFIAFEAGRLSTDVICDVLETQGIGALPRRRVSFVTRIMVSLRHRAKQMSRQIKQKKAGNSKRDDYRKLKFSSLSADMVNERILVLSRVLSRFEGISAREAGPDRVELV